MKKILLSLSAILMLAMVSHAQWVEQATGFATGSRGINYIDIVDQNTVWATAYDGSGGGAYITEFTKTTNGGTLWTPGQVMTGTAYGLGNISAIDGNTAWVAVFKGTGAQDNTCGIYKTTNGGSTWTQQPGALQGSASFADNVYFWNANEGMCHGDVKDNYFEIYTTTNGGSTWTRVPQANITATVASGEGGWTGVISAVGDSTIAFGTNKGKLYISNDRGVHWKGIATGIVPAGTNPGVNHIAFTDKNHGLVAQSTATGTIQIFKTSDNGNTWSPLTFTGNAFNNAVAAVPGSANTYVTTGADATNNMMGVTFSFDGGTTWQDMVSTIGTQYLATDWLNDSTAWAGGFNVDATSGGMFKFISVLAPVVADFSTVDTLIGPGSTATFTNLSTGGIATYAWTFQGGVPQTSNLKNPPAISYSVPGTYNVTLVCTGDFGTSTKVKNGYIHVFGVGMNELETVTVNVYPNPASDVLNIESSSRISEIQVINLVGQTVKIQAADSRNIRMNVSDLKAGVYNLKLKVENGYVNQKIVVK